MEKNEILVVYGRQYKAMTREILCQAGLADMIGNRNTLVGIKPNLLGQVLAEEGGTTHPCVIEGLIEYLQENGFRNLVMLEGSWVGDSTQETIKYCGFDRISREYQVPFWDMQKDKARKTDCGGMELNICERALKVEFLINVPVLKGHCQTKITCALKNMKGLIPNSEKRRFHRMGLQEPIGHLSVGIHQDFILVDSICGDLTFEDGGNPVEQNRLITATDPVLCDTYGCYLLDIPLEAVPYISIASGLGVGSCHLADAVVRVFSEKESDTGITYAEGNQIPAERIEEIRTHLASPDLSDEMKHTGGEETNMWEKEAKEACAGGYRQVMKLAEKAEAVDSCSACYGYLIPALQMLEQDHLLEKLREKICIGQGYRGKTGELGVGNCTCRFNHTVSGCPPTENQIYEFLKEYIQGNQETGTN